MQCRYYTDEERVEIRRELLKEMEERKVCVSVSASVPLSACHTCISPPGGQDTEISTVVSGHVGVMLTGRRMWYGTACRAYTTYISYMM